MLSRDEEQQIRETVRRSLDQVLGSSGSTPSGAGASGSDRHAEAERIIADESERYYSERGLIRHESRSGRVSWLTPAEVAEIRSERGSSRHRHRPRFKVDRKVALVWAVTLLLAGLLVAYLIGTETFAGIGTDGVPSSYLTSPLPAPPA